MFYAKTFTYTISLNAQDKFMKWVFNTTVKITNVLKLYSSSLTRPAH